ncbi:MAG TPA: thiamine pyrophosphate-dependent enzyme [Polyangiaceae bacterium]
MPETPDTAEVPHLRADDPALGLLRVLRDDGRTDPATDPFLPPETLLSMYREMRRVRALDSALVLLQRQGRIGFHGACLGQEAVPIGTAFALELVDWVFPALRESSVMLVRGFPLARYVSQSFGSSGDVQKGRQMPSTMSAREVNVASGSTSVATQLPQCVGVAWAAKKSRARIVSVGFVGEGGTSTPDFHSAMNFAAVFRVPCIIVCQNNQFAISLPAARQTASINFAVKAKAYGMPGVRVDGNDILAVYRAVTEARVRAIAGAGPTFLECVTQRMSSLDIGSRDESSPDTGSRGVKETEDLEPREEDAPLLPANDPVDRFRRHLEYLGILDAAAETALAEGLNREISDAIKAAAAEPPPARSTLFDDVYAERPWHLVEQARIGEHPGDPDFLERPDDAVVE